MKYSRAQFTRIVVTLLLTFSTFSAVAGQVDSCSQRRRDIICPNRCFCESNLPRRDRTEIRNDA